MPVKIAIIGSDSFIASYIIKFLKPDFQITGFSKRNNQSLKNHYTFDHLKVNINFDTLLNYDCIINSAGTGIQNSENNTNLVYSLNTFLPIEIAMFLNTNNYKGKFITFGSYFEIGNNSQDKMFCEDEIVSSLLAVPNQYCISKRLLSRFFYSAQLSINYYHLILPTIFGKGENENRLIPYLVNSLTNLTNPSLTSGQQIRQYLHASDLSKLIKIIINESCEKGIYNVSAMETVQVNNVVKEVYSALEIQQIQSTAFTQRFDESMQHLELNSTKLNSSFPNWKPKISIKLGIQEYINQSNGRPII